MTQFLFSSPWYEKIHVSPGADDLQLPQDFAKELGNAMSVMSEPDQFDIFTSEEAIKEMFNPLNQVDIDMLTDSGLVTDAATEDSFKLDKL